MNGQETQDTPDGTLTATPLFLASHNNHEDVVKSLLAHPDSDVNKLSHRRRAQGNGTWKETALQIAAYNGNANIVRDHPYMTSAKFSGFWTPSPLVRIWD